MEGSNEIGELMFKARIDLQALDKDIADVQKRFDQKPISLKLKVDEGSLREVTKKIHDAIGSVTLGGRGGGVSGVSGFASTVGSLAGVASGNQHVSVSGGFQTVAGSATVGAYTMQGMSCPQCGDVIPPGSQKCTRCGADLRSAWQRFSSAHPIMSGAIQGAGVTARGIGYGFKGADMAVIGANRGLNAGWSVGKGIARAAAFTGRLLTHPLQTLFGVGDEPDATMRDLLTHMQASHYSHDQHFAGMNARLQGIHETLGNQPTSIAPVPSYPMPTITYGGPSAAEIGQAVASHLPRRPRRRKPKPPGGGGGGSALATVSSGDVPPEIIATRETLEMGHTSGRIGTTVISSGAPEGGGSSSSYVPGAAAMAALDRLQEEEGFQKGYAIQGSPMFNRPRRRPRDRSGAVNFGGLTGAMATGWGNLNSNVENIFAGGVFRATNVFNTSTSAGLWNTARLGAGLSIASFASHAINNGNQYDISNGAAVAGGDVHGYLQAAIQQQQNSAWGSIPVVGGLGMGIRESITGDQAHISSMMAGAAFTERTRYFRGDNLNSRQGTIASSLSISDSPGDQITAVGIRSGIAKEGNRRTATAQMQEFTNKATLLDKEAEEMDDNGIIMPLWNRKKIAAKRSEANDMRNQNKKLAADNVAADSAQDQLEKAEIGRIRRNETGEITRRGYAVASNNARGIDNRRADILGIEGGFRSAIDKTNDVNQQGRLRGEMNSAAGAYNRDYNVQTFGIAGGAAAGNMANVSGLIGLGGNSIGSALAGFQSQRMGLATQMAMSLQGVNPATDPARYNALIAQGHVAQNGVNIAQAQAQKAYSWNNMGLDAQALSGQRGLVQDFMGAQTAGFDYQRASNTANMPAGQAARANRIVDIQQYAAQIGEDNRKLLNRTATSRIATSATAMNEAASGQDFHAAITSISGNTKAAIEEIQADGSLTESEKSDRIRAIQQQGKAQLAGVNRSLREARYGGTAMSSNGYISFAGNSTRSVDDEDLADAGKASTDAAKGLDLTAKAVRGRIRNAVRDAAAFGERQQGDARGDGEKDKQDTNYLSQIAQSAKTMAQYLQGAMTAQ